MKKFFKFGLPVLIFVFCVASVVAYTESFSDQGEFDDWYADSVEGLRENRVISGYPDGEFKPYNNVNRAELAVILDNFARHGGIELGTRECDTDAIAIPALKIYLRDLSGEPIEGADIEFEEYKNYNYQDRDYWLDDSGDGEYTLEEETGQFMLTISKTGYNDHVESLHIQERNDCHPITEYRTITLTPASE